MAIALILLIGAGLMIRSLVKLQSVNLGFVPDNVVTMAAPSRHPTPGFHDQLLERVRALPGVQSASLGSTAPLHGYNSMTAMDIEGRARERAGRCRASQRISGFLQHTWNTASAGTDVQRS